MNQNQLREFVVQPVLQKLDRVVPYSETAVELLMMTQAHETQGGRYIKQVQGPACGIYQIEPATHEDIWKNFLKYKGQRVMEWVRDWITAAGTEEQELCGNLLYQTAIARMIYYRDPEPLPSEDLRTVEGVLQLARYAKRVWNTSAGKASVQDYKDAYIRHCI